MCVSKTQTPLDQAKFKRAQATCMRHCVWLVDMRSSDVAPPRATAALWSHRHTTPPEPPFPPPHAPQPPRACAALPLINTPTDPCVVRVRGCWDSVHQQEQQNEVDGEAQQASAAQGGDGGQADGRA